MATFIHGTFQDDTKKITVKVFENKSDTAKSRFDNFAVGVDADMIVIGGGAEATDAPQGAYLTASYPSADFTQWLASSKDHVHANAHNLRVFAIGLKIDGVTPQQLSSKVKLFSSAPVLDSHPQATATVDAGYILTGGGFFIDWAQFNANGGNLATASMPINSTSWHAKSKDHIIGNKALLTCHAIGIMQNFSIGNLLIKLQGDSQSNVSSPASHPSTTCVLASGFALTGVGAFADWKTQGSLIWKLRPTTQVAPSPQESEVGSKDLDNPEAIAITAYALGIKHS